MHSLTSSHGNFSGDQILIEWCTVDGAVVFGFRPSTWFMRSSWDLTVVVFGISSGRNLNVLPVGVTTIGPNGK
jgi:hypothetical protein